MTKYISEYIESLENKILNDKITKKDYCSYSSIQFAFA